MSLKGYVPGTVSVQGLHSISEASLKKYLREKIKLKSDGKQKQARKYILLIVPNVEGCN